MFKWISNALKRLSRPKRNRLDIISQYIDLAKEKQLEIGITTNYDNELVIIMNTKGLKRLSVKKVKGLNDQPQEDIKAESPPKEEKQLKKRGRKKKNKPSE